MNAPVIDLGLHRKQGLALRSEATEILFGGAAGGGKSHFLRAAAIIWGCEIPGLQIYIFRRIEGDLIKNHVEGPKGFRALLAPLVDSGHAEIVAGEIRLWNGSKIWLCHCKDEAHRYKYQGAEIHVLLIDEATHFSDTIYRFLRSRVRMVGIKNQHALAGRFPRIVCSANPGGAGHGWVKATFVDPQEPLKVWRAPESEGGMLRQFIPARIEDNPSLETDDPTYRSKLRGMGSAALVKAMEEGDWSAIDGAFFDCWSGRMITPAFTIPEHWLRFRSLDWGSFRPFSAGWWAVAGEDHAIAEGQLIPRGALVRYREWYGASGANRGLKLDAENVATGILERERGEKIAYGVAGTDLFQSNGGPSLAERMGRLRLQYQPADTKRGPGWDRMRALMVGHDGAPMLYCFETCRDSIRTIPALQHDPTRPEDLDSNAEDHAADEWRYAIMSRPWTISAPVTTRPRFLNDITINELWRIHSRQQERRI